MLRVLDLFSGIGGFSLGLERTGGFKAVAFCEIEPFCRRVLAKHWPDVRQYEDVRELTAERLAADGISVDVICGGFPCQDISSAGKGAGIDGERSGLWREYARLIGELKPVCAIIENVPALRTRGADRVLSDLEEIGYACEPALVGAIHVGAPHRRQRAWLVAHPARLQPGRQEQWPVGKRTGQGGEPIALADAAGHGWVAWRPGDAAQEPGRRQSGRGSVGAHDVADSDLTRLEGRHGGSLPECSCEWTARTSSPFPNAHGELPGRRAITRQEHCQWLVEPDVGRVAHGVPARVDRLRALGNAVVPQIPEIIGAAILASCAEMHL